MRRADREIQSFEEIVDVISRCDVCRLGLHDGDYPYILPLNFGVKVEKESQTVTLYFHSALEGHKIELMQKNNLASFEMDCRHQLQYKAEQGMCTFAFESIIGHGTIHMIEMCIRDRIIRVYNDRICEVIDNYNGSAFYEPSYVIARAYQAGGF